MSRALLWVAVAGLLVVGIVSFVLPGWAATDFPWGVGPFLAAGNAVTRPDGVVAQGRFFPEPMSQFSIRAFAAFFFALSLSAVAVALAWDLRTYLEYARSGLLLLVPITVAALLNLSVFDFAGRPGGLLYLGAYVVVGMLATVFLLTHRR